MIRGNLAVLKHSTAMKPVTFDWRALCRLQVHTGIHELWPRGEVTTRSVACILTHKGSWLQACVLTNVLMTFWAQPRKLRVWLHPAHAYEAATMHVLVAGVEHCF
jgi:hypothetical protein